MYKNTLKGKAVLAAIEVGLVKQNWRGCYDVSSFCRFWDILSGHVKEFSEEGYSLAEMFSNQSDDSTKMK